MSQFGIRGFQTIPPAVKNIIIINALVYVVFNLLNIPLFNNIANQMMLFNWSTPFFHFWQLLTHMFMHASFSHIFFNMFALWMFGGAIENYMGSKRFIIFYLVSGIGAACCFMLTQNLLGFNPYEPMVGASGAIMGVLLAFGYLFPNVRIYVYFFAPVKAKYFVGFYAALELFMGIQNSSGDNVAHFAHVGGMLFGFILLKLWHYKSNPYY